MLLRLTAGRAPTMSTEFHEVRLVRERLLADSSCQPGPFQNQQQTLDVAAPDSGGPVCANLARLLDHPCDPRGDSERIRRRLARSQ